MMENLPHIYAQIAASSESTQAWSLHGEESLEICVFGLQSLRSRDDSIRPTQ